MRALRLIPTLLALTGCPESCEDEPAPRRVERRMRVDGGISAFAPPDDAGCRAHYTLEEGVCVHEAFEGPNEATARSMRRAYKLGARAPIIADPAALSPEALSSPVKTDPAAAKQKRLAALDAMIARARGVAPAASRSIPSDSPAARPDGQAGASPVLPAGSPRPDSNLTQKLTELRALVERTPEQDNAQLREALEKGGFTADEMRSIIPEPLNAEAP